MLLAIAFLATAQAAVHACRATLAVPVGPPVEVDGFGSSVAEAQVEAAENAWLLAELHQHGTLWTAVMFEGAEELALVNERYAAADGASPVPGYIVAVGDCRTVSAPEGDSWKATWNGVELVADDAAAALTGARRRGCFGPWDDAQQALFDELPSVDEGERLGHSRKAWATITSDLVACMGAEPALPVAVDHSSGLRVEGSGESTLCMATRQGEPVLAGGGIALASAVANERAWRGLMTAASRLATTQALLAIQTSSALRATFGAAAWSQLHGVVAADEQAAGVCKAMAIPDPLAVGIPLTGGTSSNCQVYGAREISGGAARLSEEVALFCASGHARHLAILRAGGDTVDPIQAWGDSLRCRMMCDQAALPWSVTTSLRR